MCVTLQFALKLLQLTLTLTRIYFEGQTFTVTFINIPQAFSFSSLLPAEGGSLGLLHWLANGCLAGQR